MMFCGRVAIHHALVQSKQSYNTSNTENKIFVFPSSFSLDDIDILMNVGSPYLLEIQVLVQLVTKN
jgi:hypothetical protein